MIHLLVIAWLAIPHDLQFHDGHVTWAHREDGRHMVYHYSGPMPAPLQHYSREGDK